MNLPGRKFFTGETVFSDWFPRGGDNMIFRAERITIRSDATPSIKVTISVFTKKATEVGDGDEVVDTAPSPDVPYTIVLDDSSAAIEQEVIISGDGSAGVNGLEEMVRFKCVCSNGDDDDYVQIRIFPPVFFDQAYTS
jgi:hypothetical protein